jgi:hypothetical protein
MAVIFATGIHRAVTEEEKARDTHTVHRATNKDARSQPARSDADRSNGRYENRHNSRTKSALTQFDHVVLMAVHRFITSRDSPADANLSARDSASAKTISATHKLAFDCEKA